MTTLGFLGVGALGAPIAQKILDKYPLFICDVDEKASAPFAKKAIIVSKASELAQRVDIIFVCLPSLDSHHKALLDTSFGVIAGDRFRTLVQIGTTGPAFSRLLLNELARYKKELIDAPVTGGVPLALTGQLTSILSGNETLIAEILPYIEQYSKKIIVAGSRVGTAQTLKLINNLLSAANLSTACEALVFGARAGIDAKVILSVVNAGTGQSNATLTKIPKHVLPRSFDYGGRIEMLMKDLDALESEAQFLGVDMPLAALIRRTFQIEAEQRSEKADVTSVIRHMEENAGVQVSVGNDAN